MDVRSIKKNSKTKIKKHLWTSIIICFIVAVVVGGGYKFNTSDTIINTNNISTITSITKNNNSLDIIDTTLKNYHVDNVIESITSYKPTRGVLSVFFNQITGTGSVVLGILNAINQFLFNDSIPKLITIIIGVIIYILSYLFFQNIIVIGKKRYFLEKTKYEESSIDKLLFVYRVKKTLNVTKIMFLKQFYTILWNFTIIGGIIKHYEYSMIPYILAENPGIDSEDCFKLTKEMTKNKKFQLFKVDLSLIGWNILGGLTIGLSDIFFFNPYKEMILASIYMDLRIKNYDVNLDVEYQNSLYPSNKYFIEESKRRKWLNIDYKRDYSIETLILFFFSFSIIGWLWEVGLHLFGTGEFVNRGTMFGPWLPIYGYGGVLILVLLKKYRDNPMKLFMMSFILCGIVEYGTACYLEIFKGMKWWDYSGYFLNIDGKICFEGLLVFGLGGVMFTYLVAPMFDNIYKKVNDKVKLIIIIVLLTLYSCDLVYSHYNPNQGEGITTVSEERINQSVIPGRYLNY